MVETNKKINLRWLIPGGITLDETTLKILVLILPACIFRNNSENSWIYLIL